MVISYYYRCCGCGAGRDDHPAGSGTQQKRHGGSSHCVDVGARRQIYELLYELAEAGKTLLVMSDLYPTKEALDAAGTGAADATHESFAQLDELLAELGAATV